MIKYFYYFDRKYQLSESGDLIRCEYKEKRKHCYNNKIVKWEIYHKPKFICHYIDKDGYEHVTLHCKNKSRNYGLHILVYIIFIQNKTHIENENLGYDFEKGIFYQINHKDGNKLNNHYRNLELVTSKQNIEHACVHKLHSSQRKAKYIDVFRNGKYITTVWKLKGLSAYLATILGKPVNRGTLEHYINKEKEYKGFFFKWKCNDYRKET